jgi:hypothetical protein
MAKKCSETALQAFTRQYTDTLLWTCLDHLGHPLDQTYEITDIAPTSVEAIQLECAAFWAEHSELFTTENYTGSGCPYEQAGHDFCLTRNGHGAGFADGDWAEPAATTLTEACHQWKETWLAIYSGFLIVETC